jgi:hypothetical protein
VTPFFIGSNVARATEGGEKDLMREAAIKSVALAPVQGAFDYLGEKLLPGVGKLLPGPNIALKGGVLSRIAKGTAIGAVEEPVSEVPQQALERIAAGLPVTGKEAGEEYRTAALTAAANLRART